MQKQVKEWQHWIVNRPNENVYEVLADFKCKVNLGERVCRCCQWRLLGLPCVNVVIVMKFLGVDLYQLVDDFQS